MMLMQLDLSQNFVAVLSWNVILEFIIATVKFGAVNANLTCPMHACTVQRTFKSILFKLIYFFLIEYYMMNLSICVKAYCAPAYLGISHKTKPFSQANRREYYLPAAMQCNVMRCLNIRDNRSIISGRKTSELNISNNKICFDLLSPSLSLAL